MLTLVEALESLACWTLFPDMAIDMNSIPATTQNVRLLPSSVPGSLERERPCEGRSSINRAASVLASDGEPRPLFASDIFEARLSIA